MKLSVLLICGSGASSGFMAANIRKAAAKRDIDMDVIARSESELEDYLDEIDCLLVGPHLSYIMDEIENTIGDAKVKAALVRPEHYSVLDGDKVLDQILSMFEE